MAGLFRYKKSEVDNIDSDDDAAGTTPVLISSKKKDDRESLVEAISLQKNYATMEDTPRSVSPASDHGSDGYSDERSQTEKSTISDDKSVDIPIHQAAREGDNLRLKKIVAEFQKIYADYPEKFDRELHKLNAQGYSALHLAARYNRKNCVAFLLDSGIRANDADGEDANTPLLLAAKYNNVSTLKLLLEPQCKADPMKQNQYGTSALHFAARRGSIEACRLLLNVPEVDVNDTDNAGQTPLHMAMLGGSKPVTKLLIDKGADVLVTDIEGEGPIHFAAAEDNSELICTLTCGAIKDLPKDEREPIQRRFVNLASKEGDTALHVASQAGYEDSVRTLVAIGADVNVATNTKDTPLHMAAISGQVNIVKYLILNRAKIDARDGDQMTPLHRACQYGRLEVVQFLRKRKALLDAKDKDNYSPLMCAVWKGQNHVVEYLLDNGAKIYLCDSAGKTVLHIAVEEDRFSTLELLLQRKEAVNLIDTLDKENKSALHYAAMKGFHRALKLLLKNNAERDNVDRDEMAPIHHAAKFGHLECVNSLIKKSAASIIHCTDRKGRSPLHLAAIYGHIEVTESLINKGAESSCRDDIYWTPLDYAAQNGHYKTMKVLIDNDADVDAVDKNNSSPLHHAARNGTVEAVKLLLDSGATISLRNKYGKNCLDIAAENLNKEVCYAVIAHPRWMEALTFAEKDNKRRRKLSTESQQSGSPGLSDHQYPLEKLIERAPDVASAVLDRCIVKSDLPNTHRDYSITYYFDLLDKLPPKGRGTKYFAPNTMVLHKRQDLLSHPIIVNLVRHKWGKLGQGLYLANLLVYVAFIILLTILVLKEKREHKDTNKLGKKMGCMSSKFTEVIPWLTFIFACVQILKELIQVIFLGVKYLKEISNLLEFVLYVTTILFMLPFLLCQTGTRYTIELSDLKWNSAAVAILVGWINFLMYLKHIPFFGLHVTMFEEVLKSLLNVFIVFFILIVAFALSFFSLANVQLGFQDPGLSFVHVMVMMIGELDYDAMFTENFIHENKHMLPYKGMSVFIFLVFIILMTIVLMNLLVGLAVGDIEMVRKSAFLRILKSEVKTLKIFERSCPMFILRRIYQTKVVEYPNRRGRFRRMLDWFQTFDHKSIRHEQNEKGGEQSLREEVEIQKAEMQKNKQKLKDMVSVLEDQRDQYKKLARKLGLIDN